MVSLELAVPLFFCSFFCGGSYILVNSKNRRKLLAGYRRFVAYVYEYQKGRKGRNCGFIRVEAWEERCRMEMHLLCPGLLPNVRCDIFGFVRNAGLMDGSLIGSCTTEESRADSVIETDRNNLGGSGLSLDQMGGMILTTESGAFFGTEWDDQPVRPENFRRITRAPEEDEVQRERRSVRARGGQAEPEGRTGEENRDRGGRDSGETPEMSTMPERGRSTGEELPEMRMAPESGGRTGEEGRGREVRDREGMWEEEGVPGEGYREPERRSRGREEMPGEGIGEPENWREEMAPEVGRRTREEGWERSGRYSGEMPEERMSSEEGRRESGDRREQKLPEMRMMPESGRRTGEEGREVRDREGMWEEEGVPGEGYREPERRNRGREEMPEERMSAGEGRRESGGWGEQIPPEMGRSTEEEMREEAEKRREEEIWEEAESRRLAGLKKRASEAEREERPAWGQVREEPELQGAGRGNEGGDHRNAGAEDEAVTAAEAAQMEEIPFGEEFDPFGDGEIMSCRKIQPGDFRYFQPRDRALGNNRFLQYGFYSFGHLMIGRMKNGSYILGVPGGYDQQERFMANMFGFPYFKQCGQIRLSRGRGGYWYRLINPPKLH